MIAGRWTVSSVVASGLVVLGAVLPWHRSGQVTRNAFALARVADDLGLVSSGPRRALYGAVFLLPLVAALTLAAGVAGWHRAVGFLSLAAGALASAAILVVLQSVGKTGSGLVVTGAGAVAALGCGARTVCSGAHR